MKRLNRKISLLTALLLVMALVLTACSETDVAESGPSADAGTTVSQNAADEGIVAGLQAQIDAAITEILSENSQYREHLSDRYYLDDTLSWSAMMAVFHTQGAFYAFVTFCALVLMLTLTAFLWQRRQNNRLLRSSEGIIFALEDRQFHLCYQPVVNIETGASVSMGTATSVSGSADVFVTTTLNAENNYTRCYFGVRTPGVYSITARIVDAECDVVENS